MRSCFSGRYACVTQCRWRRRRRWTALRGESTRENPRPFTSLPLLMRWHWWRAWKGERTDPHTRTHAHNWACINKENTPMENLPHKHTQGVIIQDLTLPSLLTFISITYEITVTDFPGYTDPPESPEINNPFSSFLPCAHRQAAKWETAVHFLYNRITQSCDSSGIVHIEIFSILCKLDMSWWSDKWLAPDLWQTVPSSSVSINSFIDLRVVLNIYIVTNTDTNNTNNINANNKKYCC